MIIRELTSEDIPWIEAIVTKYFGSPHVVSRHILHDVRTLPGLIAESGEERVGLLQYDVQGGQCEIVILIAVPQRQGIGRRLLSAAQELACDRRLKRVWLMTTNNNRAALAFYAAVGGRMVAAHKGAVREARELKPDIPAFDEQGVPIEDEIEFEFAVGNEGS